jgi:serine phosphatase RsbU (regulator of sigma subunit)
MAEPPPGAVLNSRLSLAPGDTLVLCTDGVFEGRNQAGELFGIERVSDELARLSPLSVEQIVAELMRVVHEWTHEQQDDITAVVVRYVGA